VIEEIGDLLIGEVGLWVGTTRVIVVCVAAAVLKVAPRFPRSPFRGCCGFELRSFRHGCLHVGGDYRLLGRVRDWLWRGIRLWVVTCIKRPDGS